MEDNNKNNANGPKKMDKRNTIAITGYNVAPVRPKRPITKPTIKEIDFNENESEKESSPKKPRDLSATDIVIDMGNIQKAKEKSNKPSDIVVDIVDPQKPKRKSVMNLRINDSEIPQLEDDDIIIIPSPMDRNRKPSERNFKTMSRKDIIKANITALHEISLETAHNYRASKGISIKVFEDARPRDDVEYFNHSENYGKQSKDMAAVIPFFNEDNTAVQQTLNSLHNSWNHLRAASKKWHDSNLFVCLIQDGWYKASSSMKEYIKALFPGKITDNGVKKFWWEIKDFNLSTDEQKTMKDKTYIFEKKLYGDVEINPQESVKDKKRFMKITLVVKLSNRRKHNSHEWFFGKNGYADCVNPKYMLFTDAFAMYNDWCLYHLAKALDGHKKMVAVTGRQRLMSKKQQGSNHGIFSLETLYENVQLYDFESSNVIYNGAFSLGGMLPVVPGPCGMYRASNLRNDRVRGYYFKTVNEDPDKTGMVLGNLRIAEDRILTYASVVMSDIEGAYMEFINLAIFYFEAETNLDSLFYQRRRWINGSIAGYLYLLFFNFHHFRQWKTNSLIKFYIWILLFFQFLTYIMVGLAPSLSLRILYHGISYLLNYYGVKLSFDIIIIGVIVWIIYAIHVGWHHSKSKFSYVIMYPLLLMSIGTALLSVVSLVHYTFVDQKMNVYDILLSGNIVLYMAIYVLIGPFIVSLLLSGRGHSFLFMLKSFPSYFVFLPMMIAWLGSYSYARLWDLSWGNRPASEMDAVSTHKKEEIMKRFKNRNVVIIIILFFINLALFCAPIEGQLIIMTVFFFLAGYQLTFSIIYCLYKIFYKISFMFTRMSVSCKKSDVLDV